MAPKDIFSGGPMGFVGRAFLVPQTRDAWNAMEAKDISSRYDGPLTFAARRLRHLERMADLRLALLAVEVAAGAGSIVWIHLLAGG